MTLLIALQTALRARLTSTPAVTSLVPAASILDRNARPAPDPAIILGEDQAVDEGDMSRRRRRVYSTLHIWKKEPSLAGVKAIAEQIHAAVHGNRFQLGTGFHCADVRVSDMRFLRDDDGETSHGVVTIETLAGVT